MPIAGIVTAITLVLALVCVFFQKEHLAKTVSMCALASAALTAMPYLLPTEGVILRPNVIVTVLLFAVWIIANVMAPKEKKEDKKDLNRGRRLP